VQSGPSGAANLLCVNRVHNYPSAHKEGQEGPRATVSVALCTYNGAAYLGEQLDSIVAQSRPPDELVVCDDGSTDGTVGLLQAFVPEAPFPVRLYRNERNRGFAKNFERAISLCTGDFIALSDQDDVWKPEKLARLATALAKARLVV